MGIQTQVWSPELGKETKVWPGRKREEETERSHPCPNTQLIHPAAPHPEPGRGATHRVPAQVAVLAGAQGDEGIRLKTGHTIRKLVIFYDYQRPCQCNSFSFSIFSKL